MKVVVNKPVPKTLEELKNDLQEKRALFQKYLPIMTKNEMETITEHIQKQAAEVERLEKEGKNE